MNSSNSNHSALLIEDLKRQVKGGKAVFIVGAGVSIGASGQEVCSWRGLLRHGVQRCGQVCTGLPDGWAQRLEEEINSTDMDDLLSVAEKVSRKLGAPQGPEYQAWLRDALGSLTVKDNSVIKALCDFGVPIITTNYDSAIESVAPSLKPTTWRDSSGVERILRGEQQGIIHLHGHWEDPSSVVLGIRSYAEVMDDQHAQAVLRALRTLRTLVFIGFGAGLKDPNFSTFLRWAEEAFAGSEIRHFRLVLDNEKEKAQLDHPPQSRIYVISFGKAYSDLAPFLKSLAKEPARSPVKGSARSRPSGSQVKIGVVGCGYWGPHLLRNFAELSESRVSVICDRDANRLGHLQSRYPEVNVTTEFEELVGSDEVDAVVIATSLKSHYAMGEVSLRAKKHTFIEKPLARTSRECEALTSLAQENGVVLMTNHTYLYSSHIRKIKEIIDAGDIGDIQYISSRRLSLGLFQKDVNVTWDLAPHDLSILVYLMGEMPISVNCRGEAHVTKAVEDVSTLCLLFSRKRFATIQTSWLDPRKVRDMIIVGTRRMIVFDDVEPNAKIRIYDARVEMPPYCDTLAEFYQACQYGDCYIPYVRQEEPLRVACQHFLDCIRSQVQPLTGGFESARIVKILEAASLSLREDGAPVNISPSEKRK